MCDASFIGLAKVLEAPLQLAKPGAKLVALIKPQFEAGREEVGKGGVVRDPRSTNAYAPKWRSWVESQGWTRARRTESPITGPEGNVEFLLGADKEIAGEIGDRSPARGWRKARPSPYLPRRKGDCTMQSENKMFDDFVKMVNGFAGTFAGMGREAEVLGARKDARMDRRAAISSAATSSRRSRPWPPRRATRMRR